MLHVRTSLLPLAAALVPATAFAQSALPCSGGFHNVSYAGPAVQDFLVPNAPGRLVQIAVYGADGGNSESGVHDQCFDTGGQGAAAVALLRIGSGSGELAPGGTLRFIIGQAGTSADCNDCNGAWQGFGAGGGGGSGLLYLRPGGVWSTDGVILLAAGGGGGANAQATGTWSWAGCDQNGGPGKPATILDCGSDGYGPSNTSFGNLFGSGGCSGNGGGSAPTNYTFNTDYSGGGGGAFSNGSAGTGPVAGQAGFPAGGAGGTSGIYVSSGGTVYWSNWTAGGWGFGGGGVGGKGGGGGGGYSGGGGGSQGTTELDSGGGGGSSYLNSDYALFGNLAEASSPGADGSAQIYFFAPTNDEWNAPELIVDGATVSGSLCGADPMALTFCGAPIVDADVWYRYTNNSACSRNIALSTSTSGCVIYGYDGGAALTGAECRSISTGGVYSDSLSGGQTILLRVVSPASSEFSLVMSSTLTGPDCDGDGVPDACDSFNACNLPPNDDPSGAITLFADPNPVPFDSTNATGTGITSCGNLDSKDLWYRFTAPCTGTAIVFTPSPSLDTAVAIFSTQGMTQLACASSGYGDDGRIDWPMTGGDEILIRVAAEGGVGGAGQVKVVLNGDQASMDPDGDGVITACDICPGEYNPDQADLNSNGIGDACEPPDNDLCSGAEVIDLVGSDSTFVAFDMLYATYSNVGGPGYCYYVGVDRWYSYTAPLDGPVTFGFDLTSPGWDHKFQVFDGCNGQTLLCSPPLFSNGLRWDVQATAGQQLIVRVIVPGFPSPLPPGQCLLYVRRNDADGDGVTDSLDVCPGGDDALDGDGDGVPDACDVCPLGDDTVDLDANGIPDSCDGSAERYCIAAPNSVGPGALMQLQGSLSVANNDLTLLCTGLPQNAPGLFYFGPSQAQAPFGNGYRCVGGFKVRTGIVQANSSGVASRSVNNTAPPFAGHITAGSSWNFQFWYRDAIAGVTGYNLSDGLHLVFAP